MRILVVSNLYPPHFIGGYELGCRDVVEALKARGHTVRVLTSTYGLGRRRVEGEVFRTMESEWGWPPLTPAGRQFRVFRKEMRNQRAFRRLAAEFRPDVVYMWNPVMTSLSPARVAEELGLPVVYLVSDDWLTRASSETDEWERLLSSADPSRSAKVLRWAAGRTGLVGSIPPSPLVHAQFVSGFLRDQAVNAGRALRAPSVVPWGVDVERFSFRQDPIVEPRRLLYAGQLVAHKGVHTCIEALAQLVREPRWKSVTLDLVGRGTDVAYMERLHSLVRQHNLENSVRFVGLVERRELPALYRAGDMLIFSSTWQEPFSITLLEAMASGIPVLATATGGSAEILEDGVNSLVFEAGDVAACARGLERGLSNVGLLNAIRSEARRTVVAGFRFEAMVETIEQELHAAQRR